MKIGKLNVIKDKENLVIKCENKDNLGYFTCNGKYYDEVLELKVSKATALKLAKWIKENIK